MGSRTRGNLGGSGAGASRQDWAQKHNPRTLIKSGRFINKDDLDIYLSGDYITCLECLQDFRSLGRHLSCSHAMSSLEYKKKYNIPKGRSLRGESTRKASASAMKKQWENADDRREHMRQHAKDKLVGVGTVAPRLAHFENGYRKICLTCNKAFVSERRKYKYCSKACHTASEQEQIRLHEIAKIGGATRGATGIKDALGKFTKTDN